MSLQSQAASFLVDRKIDPSAKAKRNEYARKWMAEYRKRNPIRTDKQTQRATLRAKARRMARELYDRELARLYEEMGVS